MLRHLTIAIAGVLLLALPSTPASAVNTFMFNWSGAPASPQPWNPGAVNDWDLLVHNRDSQQSVEAVNAMHGPDCSGFPSTHLNTTLAGSAFICGNHFMTAMNGGGYSEVVFTPAQMVDISSGGTVQVNVSSMRNTDRDWWDFWLSPFSEQLLAPSGGIPPDLQGPEKDSISVTNTGSIPTNFGVQEFLNYVESDYGGTGQSVEACVDPLPVPDTRAEPWGHGVSSHRRDTYTLQVSPTHVTLSVMVNGAPCTLVDSPIKRLPFTQAVVQFAYHSYAPDEATQTGCCPPGWLTSGSNYGCNYPGCTPPRPCPPSGACVAGNTYHWSNAVISPAVPFTMLRGDMPITGISAPTTHTVHFAQPAPADSFLRFHALAAQGSVQFSANGGPLTAAQPAPQCGDFPSGGSCPGLDDGVYESYFTPIPAGTTSVTFTARDSSHANQPWTIQDVSIWSRGLTGQPAPAPSTTPTPTPSTNPTPTPGPTPFAIVDAPCTVTVDGSQQSGTCTGTFQPR